VSESAAPVVQGEWLHPPPPDELPHMLSVQVPDVQTLSQPPQLFGSVVVSVQFPSHETIPPVQPPDDVLHMLSTHCPPLHDMLHPPQLSGSVVVSVHPNAHIVKPDKQSLGAAGAQPPSRHRPLSQAK
jgi:hypothetical protein